MTLQPATARCRPTTLQPLRPHAWRSLRPKSLEPNASPAPPPSRMNEIGRRICDQIGRVLRLSTTTCATMEQLRPWAVPRGGAHAARLRRIAVVRQDLGGAADRAPEGFIEGSSRAWRPAASSDSRGAIDGVASAVTTYLLGPCWRCLANSVIGSRVPPPRLELRRTRRATSLDRPSQPALRLLRGGRFARLAENPAAAFAQAGALSVHAGRDPIHVGNFR
jgi:hypothetical protein